MSMDTKKCLICRKKNDTLYWHEDKETKELWCYCCACQRGYSVFDYCKIIGVSVKDFLSNDFVVKESADCEVQRMEWPSYFISLTDIRAKEGIKYVESRGLNLEGDMFYDVEHNGIVFPYYFDKYFVGAQIRLIEPWISEDGDITKMISLPGTRTSLLFYNYNQMPFVIEPRSIIVTEGAFNALSIQQSLNYIYKGPTNNPFKIIALSGSGVSQHHIDVLKGFKDSGLSVICVFDYDKAGLKGFKKLHDNNAITHQAIIQQKGVDYNDVLMSLGHEKTAKSFLKMVKEL